jgi:hypothetical protein
VSSPEPTDREPRRALRSDDTEADWSEVASVDTSNVSVIAYDPAHYPHIERHVTAEAVGAHLAGIVAGEVVRYALPRIGAPNFLPHRAFGGGVTSNSGAARARQVPQLARPRPRGL